jgi:hypothetical protein
MSPVSFFLIPFYLVISAFLVSCCSFFFLYSASLPLWFFICSLSHHVFPFCFPLPPLSPSARFIPFSLHPLFFVYFLFLVSYLFPAFRLSLYFSSLCFPVNVRAIQMWAQCLVGLTRRWCQFERSPSRFLSNVSDTGLGTSRLPLLRICAKTPT